MERDQRQL
jgi:hypothetical protein